MRPKIAALGSVLAALMTAGALLGGSGQALAYGNSGDAQQVYQLEFSGNCNNPDVCGEELGGFWGWAVLYEDGTGEAEVAGCGHLADLHGPGQQGADHEHIDFTWTEDSGLIFVTSETDVTTGHGPPTTTEIPSEYDPVAPSAAGHYSTDDLFALGLAPPPGPGVAVQFQVVALPVS